MDAPLDTQPPALRPRDAAAVAALADVVGVHANESHWWNHAAFALPLLGGGGLALVGVFARSPEALGFGLFLVACALFMLPVVLLTWRATPTAIVLTGSRALALHEGRTLRSVDWSALSRIDRVETMGNVRWKLVPADGSQHLTIDGEIADVPGLIDRAYTLSGLPRPSTHVR